MITAQVILLTQNTIEKYNIQNHWLEYFYGKKISLFLEDLFLPATKMTFGLLQSFMK